jgi:hypothetical protein
VAPVPPGLVFRALQAPGWGGAVENQREPRVRALSMRSAVHALGTAGLGSCPWAGSAHAATPCGGGCASRFSRYAGGLRHRGVLGGLGVRGDRPRSRWSVGKGQPTGCEKAFAIRSSPRSSRTRTAGGLGPRCSAAACCRLACSPGSREPLLMLAVGQYYVTIFNLNHLILCNK